MSRDLEIGNLLWDLEIRIPAEIPFPKSGVLGEMWSLTWKVLRI